MDVNTPSPETTPDAGREGYTIHLLKADGTIATVEKRRSGGRVKLTVEVRDCKGERSIPVKLARNMRSREFARAVGEMKAELLERRRKRRGNRLN